MATELAMMLHAEDRRDYSGRFLRLEVRVLHLEDDKVRNIGGDYGDNKELADLVISAQAEHDRAEGGAYGWRVHYLSPYDVKLDRAKDMVKVLTKVEKGLAKLEDELGYADSFTAYVLRVARILKVKTFIEWRVKPSGMYDTGEHYRMEARTFGYHLDEVIRKFFEDEQ